MTTSTESIRHLFTDEEKGKIAQEMAIKVVDLERAEDTKKAVVADYNAQIAGIKASTNLAATKLTNGWEMRNIKCEVEKDFERWKVRFLDMDTKKVLKERDMMPGEFQDELFKSEK